jgi:hypothetical protein
MSHLYDRDQKLICFDCKNVFTGRMFESKKCKFSAKCFHCKNGKYKPFRNGRKRLRHEFGLSDSEIDTLKTQGSSPWVDQFIIDTARFRRHDI